MTSKKPTSLRQGRISALALAAGIFYVEYSHIFAGINWHAHKCIMQIAAGMHAKIADFTEDSASLARDCAFNLP